VYSTARSERTGADFHRQRVSHRFSLRKSAREQSLLNGAALS
jgi:hypothetical protein